MALMDYIWLIRLIMEILRLIAEMALKSELRSQCFAKNLKMK